MRCINRTVKHTQAGTIGAMLSYMETRPEASFDDLRANVPQVTSMTDIELMQVIQDAGLEVGPD